MYGTPYLIQHELKDRISWFDGKSWSCYLVNSFDLWILKAHFQKEEEEYWEIFLLWQLLMSMWEALQILFLQKLFILILIPLCSLILELFSVGFQCCNRHFCFPLWHIHFCFYLLGFSLQSIFNVVAQLLSTRYLSPSFIFIPYSVLYVYTYFCIHMCVPGIDRNFFYCLSALW